MGKLEIYREMNMKKAPVFRLRLIDMAGVERFELPTRGFGIRCSANWSYTPKNRYIQIVLMDWKIRTPNTRHLAKIGESAALPIGATPLK